MGIILNNTRLGGPDIPIRIRRRIVDVKREQAISNAVINIPAG